jgi:hypothetical protein
MNLADLANYVCTKTQLVGDSDRDAAKLFLSTRYELIYNAYLWKDALGGLDILVDPVNNADHAEGIVLCPEVVDRVVAVRTAERSVRVRGLEDFYRIDADRFSMTGAPVEFALLSPIWFVWRATGNATGLTFNAPVDDYNVKVTYTDQDGNQFVKTGGGSQEEIVMDGSRITVESVFKVNTGQSPDDDMPVVVKPGYSIYTVNGKAMALTFTDTRSPSYQRIQLFSKPTAAFTLSVLGKKKFVPLNFDSEEPAIKNLDNCLIAFACGDMLKRMRQFGKAQVEYQEGAMLLQELAKLETMQAANNSRIIPDGGFGDPYFSPGARWG